MPPSSRRAPRGVSASRMRPEARGDRIGNIHLWDGATGGVLMPLSEHKQAVRALSWRSDSAVVASCGEDGKVVWWDVRDGWPLMNKPDAHSGGALDCRFDPQGELATCGRDGAVKLWSADGKETKKFSVADDTPAGSTAGRRSEPLREGLSRAADQNAGRCLKTGKSGVSGREKLGFARRNSR